MNDAILVLNAGSSSIKFALYPADVESGVVLRGQVENIGASPTLTAHRQHDANALTHALPNHATARECLSFLVDWLREQLEHYRLAGVGHRVVHGGEHLSKPVLIDAPIVAALEALIPLARTHEPYELAAIKALSALQPGLPQVACFDTAFHSTQPEVAQRFGLPHAFHEDGVRRYGFHGLSYEYIAGILPQYLGALAEERVVVAHLGSGASMCAMRARRSMATTMGFTTLDGLMMATRPGALDPGVLLYLIQERGMSPTQVNDMLYNRSGLLGVSGVSGDMRVLLASDDPRARKAIELFVYRAARELGALAAAIGGLDALIFTGGIGEHAHEVRAMICERSRWLGIEIDRESRDCRTSISKPGSRVAVCVIPTNEEIVIARHTRNLLLSQDHGGRTKEDGTTIET